MRYSLAIARKEILLAFKTPLAFIISGSFLVLSGYFFFSRLQWFNTVLLQAAASMQARPTLNADVVTPYLHLLEFILVFLMPALTMRAFTEEKRQGTLDLLLSTKANAHEVVLGKFLGIGLVLLVMILLSFAFPFGLSLVGNLELWPVVTGLLGLLLFGLSFLAIGLAVSAYSQSQTVAAVVGLVVMLLVYLISLPGGKLGEVYEKVLIGLAPPAHSDPFYRGIIQGSDVIYFVSLSLFALYLAWHAVSSFRLKNQ